MFGINPGLDAFWVGFWFGVVALTAHYLTSVQVDHGPMRYQRWRAAWVMSRDRRAARRAGMVQNRDHLPGSERTNEPENDGSGAFAREERVRTLGAPFALSIEEMAAVQAMIRHRDTVMARGEKPTKSGSILAGFGVKRGGAPRYERASEIYDVLFGAPEPVSHFPNMTVEQKHAREVLGIAKPR